MLDGLTRIGIGSASLASNILSVIDYTFTTISDTAKGEIRGDPASIPPATTNPDNEKHPGPRTGVLMMT